MIGRSKGNEMKRREINRFGVGMFTFLSIALVGLMWLCLYPYVTVSGWTGELIGTALIPLPILVFLLYQCSLYARGMEN